MIVLFLAFCRRARGPQIYTANSKCRHCRQAVSTTLSTKPQTLKFGMQASSSSSDYDFLKITRAFRIFRVAGKIKQLKRIVTAIGTSIVPMANGFLIALIFGSIFCVIGTEFFKTRCETHFSLPGPGIQFIVSAHLWLEAPFLVDTEFPKGV